MSTTEGYESLHNLSPKQLAALAVLKSGGSHDEAASAAGTHRVTVSRPRNELGARGAEVRDDQVQATDGARRGVRDAGADADRARRAGWRQLHDAEVVAGAVIDVHPEAERVSVERVGRDA